MQLKYYSLLWLIQHPQNNSAARSVYNTHSPVLTTDSRRSARIAPGVAPVFQGNRAQDPIIDTSLIYENTARLATMGSDYFSLVDPYYHAPIIPGITGLHVYSYSLDFICLDPLGSTNYGKLTNVSMVPRGSAVAAGT